MTRVFSLTICTTPPRVAVTLVAPGGVRAVAPFAGAGGALVDVDVAGIPDETGAFAVALEGVEQVGAFATIARITQAFVNVLLALVSLISRRTLAFIELKNEHFVRTC